MSNSESTLLVFPLLVKFTRTLWTIKLMSKLRFSQFTLSIQRCSSALKSLGCQERTVLGLTLYPGLWSNKHCIRTSTSKETLSLCINLSKSLCLLPTCKKSTESKSKPSIAKQSTQVYFQLLSHWTRQLGSLLEETPLTIS